MFNISKQSLSHKFSLAHKSLLITLLQFSIWVNSRSNVCVYVYYLKPGVYLNGLDALHQGLIDFRPVTVVKPQSQNPEKQHRKTLIKSNIFALNTTFDH